MCVIAPFHKFYCIYPFYILCCFYVLLCVFLFLELNGSISCMWIKTSYHALTNTYFLHLLRCKKYLENGCWSFDLKLINQYQLKTLSIYIENQSLQVYIKLTYSLFVKPHFFAKLLINATSLAFQRIKMILRRLFPVNI